MLTDLQSIRRGGVKRQQDAIEACILMRFRRGFDMIPVENWAVPHDGLGRIVVADVSDEFHRHWPTPELGIDSLIVQRPSASRPALTRVASSCGVWTRPHRTSR